MSVVGDTRIGDLDGANTFVLIGGLDLRTAPEWLDRPVSDIGEEMNRRPAAAPTRPPRTPPRTIRSRRRGTGRRTSTASAPRSWGVDTTTMRTAVTQDILGAPRRVQEQRRRDRPRRGASGLAPGNRKRVGAR